MRRLHMRLLLVSALLLGCARARPDPQHAPAARSTQPAGSGDAAVAAPAAPGSGAAASAVPVFVTGVLVRRDDHIEICPGTSVGPCAGLRVTGDVPAATLSKPGAVTVFRVPGRFDGATLDVDGAAEPTSIASEPDYRNPCPEYQTAQSGVNPDERLLQQLEAVAREHAQRIAGQWWDRERQTMVVWLKGDPADVQRAFRARAPAARVCFKGQARFSERELEALRARADRILSEAGVKLSGSSSDVVRNRITYEVEAIDAATRERLAREVGDAVEVRAFLELRQHALGQLPGPQQRGDVALVTSDLRSGARMSALGRFTVHHDPALRCVYLQDREGRRVLPIWPFGYWAQSEPLQVFDQDGNAVARAGVEIDFGGGHVELQHGRVDNACGASTAFVGAPERVR